MERILDVLKLRYTLSDPCQKNWSPGCPTIMGIEGAKRVMCGRPHTAYLPPRPVNHLRPSPPFEGSASAREHAPEQAILPKIVVHQGCGGMEQRQAEQKI